MKKDIAHSASVPAKIIAAIPAYNEEAYISGVVTAARRYVSQVIVIDDGSTDGTSREASASGALVLTHRENRGYGAAIRHCFEAAKENGADVLVTLDGDGQHDPFEIPLLVAPILNDGANLVIGSRFLKGMAGVTKTNIPGYRRFGISVITMLFNFGSKARVSDAQSGFRAYDRRILDAVLLTETGMGVSVEVVTKAIEGGFTIREVPVSCSYHAEGSTLNPVYHGLAIAWAVFKFRFQRLLHRIGDMFGKV